MSAVDIAAEREASLARQTAELVPRRAKTLLRDCPPGATHEELTEGAERLWPQSTPEHRAAIVCEGERIQTEERGRKVDPAELVTARVHPAEEEDSMADTKHKLTHEQRAIVRGIVATAMAENPDTKLSTLRRMVQEQVGVELTDPSMAHYRNWYRNNQEATKLSANGNGKSAVQEAHVQPAEQRTERPVQNVTNRLASVSVEEEPTPAAAPKVWSRDDVHFLSGFVDDAGDLVALMKFVEEWRR